MREKWDENNEWTSPYRNSIKVNLGMGFYGRTFTLSDQRYTKPGCVFVDAGIAGECSGKEGISAFKEIMARSHRLNGAQLHIDDEGGVIYMVHDQTQWIAYDDETSFARKCEMLDSGCYGGVVIWAIDQDTPDFQALSALLRDNFVSGNAVGELADEEKDAMVDE
ncbi:glycosyl hydrolases family 18-domain-containing protein [Aspergillus spectabilis]